MMLDSDTIIMHLRNRVRSIDEQLLSHTSQKQSLNPDEYKILAAKKDAILGDIALIQELEKR